MVVEVVEALRGAAPGFAIWLLLAACSCGNSNCVGDTLGPREPFWRVVSTVSEEVAVVVCGAPSILSTAGWLAIVTSARHCVVQDVPSDSEPATELRPLQLCPRVLAKMADPIEYSDEKESR